MPLGVAVISVTEVVPVVEHAVTVEHSVVKSLVAVPETMFVTLQFDTAEAEQLSVVDVTSVVPVWEHASTVVHEVTWLVVVPEMIAVASHFGTPVVVHELLFDEADDCLSAEDGFSGPSGIGPGIGG